VLITTKNNFYIEAEGKISWHNSPQKELDFIPQKMYVIKNDRTTLNLDKSKLINVL